MSVYTTVTREQLETWLTQYDVGTLTDLRGISAGIENTNYFVSTTAGRYVLTLFEKLTSVELPFYLNLMAHVADHGIPSARPLPNLAGSFLGRLNGKPCTLVSFRPGEDVKWPTAAHCRAVGITLARIHLAGLSYTATMPNPRGLRWCETVLPEIEPFLSPENAALLRDEVSFQAEHDWSALPAGAIHGDLFRDNVLFDDNRISGVIDFYFACTDALLYDVAICVNDWCVQRSGDLDRRRVTAVLAAYQSTRPLAPHEMLAWPVVLRAAALRFWVSRLYDLHLPRPGELTHAKDPRHFQAILEQHKKSPHCLEQAERNL